MGNEGGGYSLNKFRKAEGKWEDHLKPDEKRFLESYRGARDYMNLQSDGRGFDMFALLDILNMPAKLAAGVATSEGRTGLLGKKKAEALETKYKKIAAKDQLNMAYDEAKELDREYNRLRANVVEAIKNFQDFNTKLNTAKRMPRVPEREEE